MQRRISSSNRGLPRLWTASGLIEVYPAFLSLFETYHIFPLSKFPFYKGRLLQILVVVFYLILRGCARAELSLRHPGHHVGHYPFQRQDPCTSSCRVGVGSLTCTSSFIAINHWITKNIFYANKFSDIIKNSTTRRFSNAGETAPLLCTRPASVHCLCLSGCHCVCVCACEATLQPLPVASLPQLPDGSQA